MTSQEAKPPDSQPVLTTHPYPGVAGVLLGASIATCTGRLMNVGLADLRGALHLGVDEASWLNTSFNASMMFIGLNVQLGSAITDQRLLGLRGGFAPHSTGPAATGRATDVVALQVSQQALSLAISDSFVLIATCCVACLVVVAFMSNVPTQYRQIIANSMEAK